MPPSLRSPISGTMPRTRIARPSIAFPARNGQWFQSAPPRVGRRRVPMRTWPLESGFNGAAPFGARRFPIKRCKVCGHVQLQRGRAFWGAEITRHRERKTQMHSCFNGAAPFGARRCFMVRSDAAVLDSASTGPRLLGRGDTLRRPIPMVAALGFNGAAPFGARR